VVFFAIGISALLTVAALVLGGSVGYSAARNSQTAADAAVLAGTSLLQNHKQDWIETEASDVYTEVENVAEANGATLERCDLIFAAYARTGAESDVAAPCSSLATLEDADFQAVAGVRVTVSEVRDVAFSAFVDQDQVMVRSTAAATIQPVATGRSPFMVCAFAEGHPADALMVDSSDNTRYVVNPGAVGKVFVLWGNHIKYKGRDCENGSSDWRGLMDYDQVFNMNGWWSIENGNSSGVGITFEPMVAGQEGCALNDQDLVQLSAQVPCLIALPLCIEGRTGPTGFEVRCVKMGLFELTRVGNVDGVDSTIDYETPCTEASSNIVCGRFIDALPAVSGRGYAAPPDRHEFAVVKLVE
jgi:hypothetical protein